MDIFFKTETFLKLCKKQHCNPLKTLQSALLHYGFWGNPPFITYTENTGPVILRPQTDDFAMLAEQIKNDNYKIPNWYLQRSANSDYKRVNVLDLGANAGTSSLYFANQLLRAGLEPHVVGLEPQVNNYGVYYTNAVLHQLINNKEYITPVHAAIGSKAGKCNMVEPQGCKRTCAFQTKVSDDLTDGVEVLTVDQIISDHFEGTIPQIVKMDVEGAEFDVLLNKNTAWLSEVDLFYFEVHNRLDYILQNLGQDSLTNLWEVFTNSGFVSDSNYGIPGTDPDLFFINQRLFCE